MRKRYSVVVRGVGGTVRDQTSEISRHRSEASAREAAETERHRLFVVRPEEALNYRIAIYRDDREVILDVPALTSETAPLPQGPERDLSALAGMPHDEVLIDLEQPGHVRREALVIEEDEVEMPPAPPATADVDEGDTGRVPVPERRGLADEALPEGPVPEDVIARFAQSLEREERRRGKRTG